MYFLLHTLIKKKKKKALPDLSLSFFTFSLSLFFFLLYFPQRTIEPPKVGRYYNHENREEMNIQDREGIFTFPEAIEENGGITVPDNPENQLWK